jgi:Serine dehydrogenase proteinase
MSKESRVELIKAIEKERGTKVLTYVTSTRQNLEVQMALDTIRKFYEHLIFIPEEERTKTNIDLLIVSNGGDGTVPWRLVTLIREFAKQFTVLIPYRAFSAATLTSLGADKIIMHPMGMLGPTDPTVSNNFNPVDPNTKQRLGISVEDVTAYIALIKEEAGITHEDELVIAFNKLAENVHPLALGNVKRSLAQSRMMAQKLLSLHMSKTKDQHQIEEIVDNLTSKLYYHGHPINRKEAIDQIGLKTVEHASPKIEELMWKLFLEYEKEVKSEEPFNPLLEFVGANPALEAGKTAHLTISSKLAFIESSQRTDYTEITHDIFGTKNANGTYQIVPNVISQGWKIG